MLSGKLLMLKRGLQALLILIMIFVCVEGVLMRIQQIS